MQSYLHTFSQVHRTRNSGHAPMQARAAFLKVRASLFGQQWCESLPLTPFSPVGTGAPQLKRAASEAVLSDTFFYYVFALI